MSLKLGQTYLGDSLVLANAGGSVSAGDELGPSTTDGQLVAGSDGYSAFTDEGSAAGLSTNETVPSGAAAVAVDCGPVSYEAGETISPGDAVGINSGTLRRANSGDSSPNVIGIAGHGGGEDGGEDYAAGDDVPVYLLV